LDDDTFREMARAYPAVSPIRELRHALSSMRLHDLAVGHDDRNRTILGAFGSRTGRNQPSNTKYIFGPSTWLRSLIKPPPGMGLAYIDWCTQEFAVAAALSGDAAMIAAYESGDPYLEFGKQIGALPADATKKTHAAARQLYKTCILGIGYGMGAGSLAQRVGRLPLEARGILRAYQQTYRTFWDWSDAAVAHAMLTGSLYTRFGWHVHAGPDVNPRSLRNFPMQANGAEMMRLAACFATEQGIEVCAPVHDAFLIAAPLDRLDDAVIRMRAAMAQASRAVLAGFEIRTDVHRVDYPHRYTDGRGAVMWERVLGLIARCRQARRVA
jgi:DNA polymerase I